MINIIFNSYLTTKVLKHEDIAMEKRYIYNMAFLNGMILVLSSVYEIRLLNILMLVWLSYIAFVDNMTCFVYDCMEYYGVIIMIAGLTELFDGGLAKCFERLVLTLIMVVLFIIGEKAGCYGKGDTDIFAVLCIVYPKQIYVAGIFILSVCLFVLRYAGEIIMNRGRLGERKPFIPSIYMGNVLMTVYLIASSQR